MSVIKGFKILVEFEFGFEKKKKLRKNGEKKKKKMRVLRFFSGTSHFSNVKPHNDRQVLNFLFPIPTFLISFHY